MAVKKYDLINFGETRSSSVEGNYMSPENGIGNQAVSLPGPDFNRNNPNSFKTVIGRTDLSVRVGWQAVAGMSDLIITVGLPTFWLYDSYLHGDLESRLNEIMRDSLSEATTNGDIVRIETRSKYDENGYAEIDSSYSYENSDISAPGTNYDDVNTLNYKEKRFFTSEGKGLTKEQYERLTERRKEAMEKYNEIKDFYDGVSSESRQRERSYDYKDVPIMNGGGGGGGGSIRQIPTAIV